MKKKLIILAGSLMTLVICATTYFSVNANSDVSLLMQNVEALAEGESNCNYTNGYTSFTGRSGGGYDCCMVWRDLRPDDNMCQ